MAGEWLAYGELGLAVAGFAPFALHRWSCGRWMKQQLVCPEEMSGLDMTILLPVWNEGLIIENKLSNLAKQDFKSKLLLIDSASTDDTLSKAKSWLEDFPDAFDSYRIIEMPQRLGKTSAVITALDALSDEDGIIVMTDADATMMPGALSRINQWFSNPQIGAVGGTPIRNGELGSEENHRDLYTLLRVGESSHDSTPFLEGSLLAWRAGSVIATDLYAKANADDAQISTAIRLKGLRSIQDPELTFTDQMPLTAKEQRRQKVRRAQGLVRLLSRKRKFWFSKRQGRFSKILRRNAWMHLLSPLAITGAAMLAIFRNIAYLPDSNLMFSLTLMEFYCLTSWVLTRSNKSFFGIKIAGTIMCGLESLLVAIMLAGRGKSLHMWDQHKDVRDALSKR
ncbi:MAG: glycosyltransferase [Candidatus Poseidoniales archaeon]|nr:MAG: glycosyltransferase [Candidatus Poseidoniales archaeon]